MTENKNKNNIVSLFRKKKQPTSKTGFALFKEGQTLYEMKKFKFALEKFQEAENLGYKTCDLYDAIYNTLYELSDKSDESLQEMAIYAKKSIELDSTNGDAYYNLALTHLWRNQPEEALENFLLAEKHGSNYTNTYANIANIYDYLNNYNKAMEYATLSISKYPETPLGYSVKGNIYYQNNNYKKAIHYFKLAIKYGYNSTDYNKLAFCYIEQDEYDKAIKLLKEALKLEKNSDYYFQLAGCYFNKNCFKKALTYINKALILNKDVATYRLKTDILYNLNEYDKCLKNIQEVEKLDPDNKYIDIAYAKIYIALEKYDKATQLVDKVIKRKKEYIAEAYKLKTQIYNNQNDCANTIKYGTNAIEYEEDDYVYFELSKAYYESGRALTGLKYIEKALNINDYIMYIATKCSILVLLEEFDKAAQLIKDNWSALKDNDYNMNLLITLLYYKLGNFEEAEKYRNEILKEKDNKENIAIINCAKNIASHNTTEAKKCIEILEQIQGEVSILSLSFKVEIEYMEKNYQTVLCYIKELQELNPYPESVDCAIEVATLYKLGQYEDCIKLLFKYSDRNYVEFSPKNKHIRALIKVLTNRFPKDKKLKNIKNNLQYLYAETI